MAVPHVIKALGKKRASLLGEIAALERQIEAIRSKIKIINASLALFGYRGSGNEFKPYKPPHKTIFRTGQLKRMVLSVRREAGRPLTNQEIAVEVSRSLGWELTPDLLRAMASKVKDVTKRLPRPKTQEKENVS
jgi:hypothetical protein